MKKIFTQELKHLTKRKPDSNKGDFGHVLIIGGDRRMGGAAIMAAEAAYRTGAGKVTVLTKKENITALLSRLPNAMTLSSDLVAEKILKNKTVIVIGCGLGKSPWAKKLFKMAMNSNLPKVIDADALNILSTAKENFDLSNSIITPHVGEASRLLKISIDKIQENRQAAVKKLYKKFGAVTVLKGNGTLVLGNKKVVYKCPYGNPGMATAGMGDVLSGLIGGLIAQNLENEKAAILGVNIHALAGDFVAKKQGEVGIMPQDLLAHIPRIINQLEPLLP